MQPNGNKELKVVTIGLAVIFFAFWASDLVLLVVLYQLMVAQWWQQSNEYEFDQGARLSFNSQLQTSFV